MANEIDLVVGNQAFTQITRLLTELGKVDTSFTELSAKFAALGNNTNTIKSTADLAKLTAENAKLNAVIEQQIKDFSDLNAKLTQANTARTASTKGVTEETIALRAKNAETTLEIKATTDVLGAYAKLDAQHKLAVKSAQDLAVATGRTGQSYEDAKNKANELGNRLRVIDTDIGKHTRNVGNYSSSWNGLGNSINQLTREAPAFANSVQTGFMALSNNIPILTDELGVLIQKNKDLQAEGKPTQSILKTLAGAFFSWQTAISLGVTILTVYGAKLVDLARGLGDVKRELKGLEQAQKESDGRISNTTRNIQAQTEIAIAQAKRRGVSDKELNDIKLQGEKDVLLNLQKERDLAKKTYDEAVTYRENGIKGIKLQYQEELKEYNKSVAEKRKSGEFVSIDEQMKVQRNLVYKNEQEIKRIKTTSNDEVFKMISDNYTKTENAVKIHGQELSVLNENLRTQEYESTLKGNKKLDKLEDERAKAEKERIENQFKGEIADLENKKNTAENRLDLFSGEVKDKIALSMNLASKEIDLAEKVYQYNVFLAGKDAGLLSKAASEKSTAIENSFKENIERSGKFYSDFFKKADDELPKSIFGDKYKMTDQQKADLKKHEDLVKQTADEMKNYLSSFGTEFASKAGFSETFSMLSGNIAGFGTDAKVTFVAIAESAQEMFNMIAEASQANFEQEFARLDKQKETSLKFEIGRAHV
jgi:hypothetical protein